MISLHEISFRIQCQALGFGFLLYSIVSVCAAEEPMTLTLAAHDYPPLIAQNRPYGGLLTRIVTESFAIEGVKLHVEYVPNNRSIAGVMAGIYTGSYGWAHSPDRDKKMLYSSDPIYTFRMVFFQRRGGEYPWKSLADLSQYRIGATLGNHYSDEFSALEAAGTLHVDNATDDKTNLIKLLRNRIDLFPMEETCGQFLIKEIFTPTDQQKIDYQTGAIWSVPTYVVIRRDYPNAKEIIDRFDRGFRQLGQNGKLAKLIKETLDAVSKTDPPTQDNAHDR